MALEAFWETSAFFALLIRDDSRHGIIQAVLREQERRGAKSVTTSWVIGETCTLLVIRRYPHLVGRLLELVESTAALVCMHPDESHFAQAAGFLRKHLDQRFSLVDCSSMVIACELSLRRVLTTDRYFHACDFELPLLR
jgi:predicted nucleic acid-binding protein